MSVVWGRFLQIYPCLCVFVGEMQAIHHRAKLSGHLGLAHLKLPENCASRVGEGLGTVACSSGNRRKLF